MSTVRIAVANIQIPGSPEESIALARDAVAEAGRREAGVICFPECFVPGYRWSNVSAPPPEAEFLNRAMAAVADAARRAKIAVSLDTERIRITAYR